MCPPHPNFCGPDDALHRTGPAQTSPQKRAMDFSRTTLDNGLQIILRESHTAPVASVWLFYRVGSRHEIPGQTGISHWVEHMLFKGTDRFPPGALDRMVARAGGMFNAMTAQDWTTYYATLPSARIGLALEIESDRMVNARFDAEEAEFERTVILSEREGSENSYFWRLETEVQAAAFQVHSYRHPIIGWKDDLHIIQRDQLVQHYRTFYAPNNALLVATGDFDQAWMLGQIEAQFGTLAPAPPPPVVQLTEPPQQAERRIILRGPEPTAYLIISFHAPAATDPDFFPLIVLDAVLSGAKGLGLTGGDGNNRSTRLHRALVDTHLAVGVESSFRPTIDPDLFSFYATLAPDVPHAQVEAAIWAELAAIQQEGVQPAELTKAIKQTKTQFAFSNESVTSQAYWLGFSDIVADTSWLADWFTLLSQVTSADVQRVARTYFRPSGQTVGWYVPAPHEFALDEFEVDDLEQGELKQDELDLDHSASKQDEPDGAGKAIHP